MKNKKNFFRRMSTGLASLVIALTMASCSKKEELPEGFHIDIMNQTSMSEHIEEYQKLFNSNEDTIINDYNEYLALYNKLLSTEDDYYHAIKKEYETTWIDGKTITCENKNTEDDGVITYYNGNPITGTIKKIQGNSVQIKDGAYNYTFTLEDNNDLSIDIKNKNSSLYYYLITLKSDNSYSIQIENEIYNFDSTGILMSSKRFGNYEIYRKEYKDGNINVYTEYENDKIYKITREDGTYTEMYYNSLPNTVKEKFPIYKLHGTYDTITIEYDKDDNIISALFETNNEDEKSKIEMNPDGSYYGTEKYIGKDSTTEITEQCNSEGEVERTTKEYNNYGRLISTEVHKITKDDITKLKTIDGNVVEELRDNILYFYDDEGNIQEYYKYFGKNYVIYDANDIKKEFHNVDKNEIITYYEDGNIASIDNNKKYVELYNSKKLKYYHNKDNKMTINIGGVDYTLEYYDEISFYESGKLNSIVDHSEGTTKEYYESSKLKYTKERDKRTEYWYYEDGKVEQYLINGNGKSYYSDRTIHEIYKDNKVIKSYYENGNIEYEKTENGEKEYYEDGKPKQIKEDDETTVYYESGGIRWITRPGYCIKYNEDGSIYSESKNMLEVYYRDGIIYEYKNAGFSKENKNITIDGKIYVLGNHDSITIYPSGKIKEINRENYKKCFYENGNVSYEKNKDSEKSYYENGNKKSILDNGNGKSYYENGNEYETYEDGIVIRSFHENGNLKYEKIDNVEKTYYDNNQLENIYIDGVRVESFYSDGKIRYTNYNGEEKSFYENGVVSSEIINGVKYTYYTTGDLRSTIENGITTEYRDDRVYSVGTRDHKVIYPIAEDYSFTISYDRIYTEDNSHYDEKYQYFQNDELLYTSHEYNFSGYDYDNEYGVTQVLIYSRDDQQRYSIYINEDYYGNAK